MISLMKIDYIYGYSYALVKNNKRTQCPSYTRNSLSRSINIWEVNLKEQQKNKYLILVQNMIVMLFFQT